MFAGYTRISIFIEFIYIRTPPWIKAREQNLILKLPRDDIEKAKKKYRLVKPDTAHTRIQTHGKTITYYTHLYKTVRRLWGGIQ